MPKGVCNRCGEYKWINKHHVFPKKFFGTKDNNETVSLCLDCHAEIHSILPKDKQEKTFYSNFMLKFLSGASIIAVLLMLITKIAGLW